MRTHRRGVIFWIVLVLAAAYSATPTLFGQPQPADVGGSRVTTDALKPWQHHIFRASNPNGGELRHLRTSLLRGVDASVYDDALRSLAEAQREDGGWGGENQWSSTDDEKTAAPALAAIERIAEMQAAGDDVPEWLYTMADRAVDFLIEAQHSSYLFRQAIDETIPANQRYRLQPTLNDLASSSSCRVLRRALEVLAPLWEKDLGQLMGSRKAEKVRGRLLMAAVTIGRLYRDHGGFYDQYDGARWKPNNPPALLPLQARPQEPVALSNNAAAYAIEILIEAHLAQPERGGFLLFYAEAIADDLERRAFTIAGEKWWPTYYRGVDDPAPIFGTFMGTTSLYQADSPNNWTKNPRAAIALARSYPPVP